MKQLLTTALLFCVLTAFSQDNPFEKYGYTPTIATLSKGKYVEFFDRDTVVQIGRVIFNTKTKSIMGFVEYDTMRSEATLEPDLVSRWISPDPLAHLAPGWTPYRYGFNNPIYYVDPTGLYEDNYELSESGDITLTEKTDDNFDMLTTADGSKSLKVDKGVLGSKKSETYTTSAGENLTYDVFKSRGDTKSKGLFEFVASNSNVEWSLYQTGIAGDKGLNFLTTSGDLATEKGSVGFLNNQLMNGYSIRSHTHNHPRQSAYPSGLDDGGGDIGFATGVENWYMGKYSGRQKPIFQIYTSGDGQYIQYDKNSTRSDFFSITLPAVEINGN